MLSLSPESFIHSELFREETEVKEAKAEIVTSKNHMLNQDQSMPTSIADRKSSNDIKQEVIESSDQIQFMNSSSKGIMKASPKWKFVSSDSPADDSSVPRKLPRKEKLLEQDSSIKISREYNMKAEEDVQPTKKAKISVNHTSGSSFITQSSEAQSFYPSVSHRFLAAPEAVSGHLLLGTKPKKCILVDSDFEEVGWTSPICFC